MRWPGRSSAGVVLVGACDTPLATDRVVEIEGAQPVPFRGTVDGQLSFIAPFEPGSLDRCNANTTAGGEDSGALVSGFDRATGQWTRLGHTRIQTTFCLDPETGVAPQGEGTLTAANGDRLYIVLANEPEPTDDPNIAIATGQQEVVEGTGRLEGASGVQSCSFETNPTPCGSTAGARAPSASTPRPGEPIRRAAGTGPA